ncbi:hypothetical protein REC12_23605 [Desulfosporosinus sp. PR]|uniref:hypothetical protein n=1 Tax=Candidatus Desulfosporosinus nitrosoreducens TaxID=3401928 RepID=UPI0027FEE9D8|nr:hypothetical protein [Desulfosporosinus sp. PR]MDQ7096586.1 hypothetical protein [Desulfosporosinus sp. PR]
MNYEIIAEMVHSLVKNNHNMALCEQGVSSAKILPNEVSIIQRVFSKYEATGDAVTIGIIPEGMWE